VKTSYLKIRLSVSFSRWDEAAPAVRTRPEAEDIAGKGNSEMVGHLMRGEVNPPTVRTPKLPIQMQESVTP